MNEAARAKRAPRLEAQINKAGAGWVALSFAFQDLTFNLRSAQVESLSTLVSPGLRVAGSNWTLGGIRAESVNQAFQTEINATIDAQTKAALAAGNNKILDGALTRETMDQLFGKIFNRE